MSLTMADPAWKVGALMKAQLVCIGNSRTNTPGLAGAPRRGGRWRPLAGRVLLVCSALALGACAASSHGTAAAQAAVEAGQWDRAAIEDAKLSQDASATVEARQGAEYRLGVSLYRFGLRAVGASIFKAIGSTPEHAAREEALRSLLPLALELPMGANIEAPLRQSDEAARAGALEDLPSPVRSRVRYLLGHFEYSKEDARGRAPGAGAANYGAAIAQLQKVEDGDLPRARILIAMCHVRSRKSVPAVAALESALEALSSRTADPEARRLVDLANLLQARIYFSTAVRLDDTRNVIVGDRAKLTKALGHFKKIDDASPFGLDARWERAWVELAMGDQKGALSDFRSAIGTPGAYVPEAEQMEANVRWGMGEKDAALESMRSFVTKYSPIQSALAELTGGLAKQADPDAAAFALLTQAKDHPDELPAAIRLVVLHAFGDRRVLENLEYARLLADERKRFEASAAELRGSIAGERVRKALEDERQALVRRSAEMVRSRLADETANLKTLLQDVEAALASDSGTAVSRGLLDREGLRRQSSSRQALSSSPHPVSVSYMQL